jgi:antitoxin VapB
MKNAKLLMDGDDQVVLLPDEFRFEGEEVRISRDGDKVILEPMTPNDMPTEPEANP